MSHKRVDYAGLQSAARLFEKSFDHDNQLEDQFRFVNYGQSHNYTFPREGDLESISHLGDRVIPLPKDLRPRKGKELETNRLMGVFPEINCLWVSVDSTFRMWNFHSSHTDIIEGPSLDQFIISAALVKAQDGVFTEDIKWLVLIATHVEVVVLGVRRDPDTEDGQISLLHSADITLNPCVLTVPTDNVNMFSMIGTDEGLIFMCGSDGCLYELVYASKSGLFQQFWHGSKCRKINRSQAPYTSFVPHFVRSLAFAPDALFDICYDSSRRLLYTLAERSSCITVYAVEGMEGLTKLTSATMSSLATKDTLAAAGLQKSDTELVSLSVGPTNSEIGLVAISTTGARFFITVGSDMYRSLAIKHIKPSPFQGTGMEAKLALYSNGIVLMATEKENTPSLVCLTPAPHTQSHMSELCETVHQSSFTVRPEEPFVQVTAMREINLHGYNNVLTAPSWNDALTQHARKPREFAIVTDYSLYFVVKYRPVDHLWRLVGQPLNADDLPNFVTTYGAEEACEACLTLICAPSPTQNVPGSVVDQPSTHQIRTSLEAAYRYFCSVDADSLNDVGAMTPSAPFPGAYGGGVFPGSQDLREVGRLLSSMGWGGLLLYLSRLLSRCWSIPIFQYTQDSGYSEQKDVSVYLWVQMRVPLAALAQFMGEHLKGHADWDSHHRSSSSRVRPDFLGDTSTGPDAALPPDRQREGVLLVRNIFNFVTRVLHALRLLEIVFTHSAGVHRFLNDLNVPQQERDEVGRLTLNKMVVEESAHSAVQLLLTALMRDGKDRTEKEVQEMCPSFGEDIHESTAQALMQKARHAHGDEQRAWFEDAKKKYLEIVANVNVVPVCVEFRNHGYYEGAIDLVLEKIDSLQSSSSHESMEARQICYNQVTAVLEDLSPKELMEDTSSHGSRTIDKAALKLSILDRVLESKDEGLHNSVFLWLSDHDMGRDIFQLPSVTKNPSFEPFLRKNEQLHPLLAKYYIDRKKYAHAAITLFNLREAKDISLDQRIEFLSQSLANANSCVGADHALVAGIVEEIQETLDVATVQKKVLFDLQKRASLVHSRLENLKTRNQGSAPPQQVAAAIDMASEELNHLHHAVQNLNATLLDISSLFNDYAATFELYEYCIELIHCSSPEDGKQPQLALKYWRLLIESVEREVQDEAHVKSYGRDFVVRELSARLNTHVQRIGRIVKHDSPCFPAGYLLVELEKREAQAEHWQEDPKSAAERSSAAVVKVMLAVGVPPLQLCRLYYDALAKDRNRDRQHEVVCLVCHFCVAVEMLLHLSQASKEVVEANNLTMQLTSEVLGQALTQPAYVAIARVELEKTTERLRQGSSQSRSYWRGTN